MNRKFFLAMTISLLLYATFLYLIFEIYPTIGKILLPSLLLMHLVSLFMIYFAYKGEKFRIPIIGNFAAKISKIDDEETDIK